MPTGKKLNWRDVVPSRDFRFGTPMKGNSHDGWSIPLRVFDKESKEEVYFDHQTPLLAMPFGVVAKEIGGKMSYRVGLSFPGVRYDIAKKDFTGGEERIEYLKWLQSIDDFNRQTAFENMSVWFPNAKPLKKDTLDEFYFQNVWLGEKVLQGEYSPTMTTKLRVRKKGDEDVIATRIYNQKKQEIEYNDISGDQGKHLKCYARLSTSGLWYAGRNFGMSFSVSELLVYENETYTGCSIEVPGEMECTIGPDGMEFIPGDSTPSELESKAVDKKRSAPEFNQSSKKDEEEEDEEAEDEGTNKKRKTTTKKKKKAKKTTSDSDSGGDEEEDEESE